MVRGEPNTSCICSRYVRAPEPRFDSTAYTTAKDVWSFGCSLGELFFPRKDVFIQERFVERQSILTAALSASSTSTNWSMVCYPLSSSSQWEEAQSKRKNLHPIHTHFIRVRFLFLPKSRENCGEVELKGGGVEDGPVQIHALERS